MSSGDPVVIVDPVDTVTNVARSCFGINGVQQFFSSRLQELEVRCIEWVAANKFRAQVPAPSP
eukprot:5714956-Prorocentrum_lima.AAC.1